MTTAPVLGSVLDLHGRISRGGPDAGEAPGGPRMQWQHQPAARQVPLRAADGALPGCAYCRRGRSSRPERRGRREAQPGRECHPVGVGVPVYKPLLLTAAPPPSGRLHAFELKLDGMRAGVRVAEGRVQIISRHGKHWTQAFPVICEAALKLPLQAALIDAEIAVLMPSGLTSFQALQHRTSLPPGARLCAHAFDLMHLDGRDIGKEPFEARKHLLEELLRGCDEALRYTPHLEGDGAEIFRHAARLGAEGIVAKRRGSRYTAGRSRDWLKSKCLRTECFVLGGFTERAGRAIVHGGASSVGAMLVGYHDADGHLRYAGSVGTGQGFTHAFLRELRAQLAAIETPESPFAGFRPNTLRSPWSSSHQRGLPVRWVRPLIVVEVAFTELTEGSFLRHPSFRRFRKDLNAAAVVRATPVRG